MRRCKKCWFVLGCVLIGRREKEFQIAVKASLTSKQIFDGWGWGWGGECPLFFFLCPPKAYRQDEASRSHLTVGHKRSG